MTEILATCAAVALTAAFALPVPAVLRRKSALTASAIRIRSRCLFTAQVPPLRVSLRSGPGYGYYRPYRSYYNAPYYAYAPRRTIVRTIGRASASALARSGSVSASSRSEAFQ